ncbi:lytic transglycosylase domain-containing protein [Streptomyces silvisoli]|uniref:Lytic transglycosylase domain-containing protein n=1 Tax=Streptomyces silvisoli TaxID=3034235 RepID=A0ABT5ZSM5_9ACTN|nr:lytic transglycosylase domain-containing protein [Streptomyces silvisoli]MDF3292829.1 lytic transglycosylase domain-containing protein [Streptomyces silvisoli]
MEIQTRRSGRRGCLVGLAFGAVLVVAAAVGIVWWLTRPPALPTIPNQYLATVQSAARTCPELSVPMLAAQLDAESHWNPQADSGQAQGIAQFYPSTWAEWGKDYTGDGKADVWNPADAIPAQGAYMCHLFNEVKSIPGDPTQLALAAYNAGPGAVLKAQGIPQIPETQNYVNRIEALIPKYTQTYAKQIGASPSPSGN